MGNDYIIPDDDMLNLSIIFFFSKYYRLLWFSGGFWWVGCEQRVDFTVEVVWAVFLGFIVLLIRVWVDYGRVSGRSVM